MLESLGSWAAQTVSGAMPLALPVAFLAGLVSFFSPCVVPLLPGYISYATGLSAAEIVAARPRTRMWRALAGTVLFVAGYGVVFVGSATLAGALGGIVLRWQGPLTRAMGAIMIVLGLIFAGLVRFGQRDLRPTRLPRVGLAAAPLVGLVFGLGWTPCTGPTLGAVLTMALNAGSAAKGAWLAVAYTLGLGVPFIVAAVAFQRISRAVAFLRARQELIMRIGGLLMIATGALMITGVWGWLMGVIRQVVSGFVTVI